MLSASIAYLHYLSFMILFAALAFELHLLKASLSATDARRLLLADTIYGVSAAALLVTGALRFAYLEKGMRFYLANPVFHLKIGLFLAVGLISIFPTVEFLRWRAAIRRGEGVELEARRFLYLGRVIRFELAAVALIPLLAALMARGLGSGW
jgi:putative membrane protein